MENDSMVIWVVIAAIAVFIAIALGCLVALFLFARKRHRELADLPITRISEAPDGVIVKIRGTVSVADQVLSDPISGRECVAYHVWVACETEQTVGPRRNWSHVTLAKKEEQVDFLLEDFSDTARVKPPLALSGLRLDEAADPTRVACFLADAGVAKPDKPLFPGIQSIREGKTVTVVGMARRVRDNSANEIVVIEPRPKRNSVWVTDQQSDHGGAQY